jgi:hypothetical protein
MNAMRHDQADTMIYALGVDANTSGGYYLEQLWARRLDDRRFELCCIPLYIYGFALGDVVEVIRQEKLDVIERIVQTSGCITLRILFNANAKMVERNRIFQMLVEIGCQTEWSSKISKNLLAISVASDEQAQVVMHLLNQEQQSDRLTYESAVVDQIVTAGIESVGAKLPGAIFAHLNPIWQNEADFILQVPVSNPRNPGGYYLEHLWVKQLGNNRFSLCCIPFRLYDLALGDVVEVSQHGDGVTHDLKRISLSGQHTLRVWFGGSTHGKCRDILLVELDKLNCLVEWESNDLMATSAPSNREAQRVVDLLHQRQLEGCLVYETQHLFPSTC